MGTGVTLGPPFAGWLFDVSGEYYYSFGFAAIAMGAGAVVLLLPMSCFGSTDESGNRKVDTTSGDSEGKTTTTTTTTTTRP